MSRMRLLQDLRLMKFEAILSKRTAGELTQEQGAEILGISVLTLRRWEGRYEAEGLKGFTIAGLVSWTNRSTRSPLRTAAFCAYLPPPNLRKAAHGPPCPIRF